MDRPNKREIARTVGFCIKKIVNENKETKTFFLDTKVNAIPGQFCMLWLPGVDEKPISISYTDPLGFTVRRVGPFTSKLFNLKKGDLLGVRGPYGNGFKPRKNSIIISGGCGAAPLALLAELVNPITIAGAKTKDELLFIKRFKEASKKVIITTDDGSAGMKGPATKALEQLLKEGESSRKPQVSCIYACGPEAMLVKSVQLADRYNIPIQVSMERYMKCGIGICGTCALGTYRVCKDGPVFSGEKLKGTEFGKYKLDKSGMWTSV